MRRAARIDANQPAIVAALKTVGCTVRSLAAVGDDFPDLIVGFRGGNYLMEVKNQASGGNHRGQSKISSGQRDHVDIWAGQTAIVWSVEEALAVVGFSVNGAGHLCETRRIQSQ